MASGGKFGGEGAAMKCGVLLIGVMAGMQAELLAVLYPSMLPAENSPFTKLCAAIYHRGKKQPSSYQAKFESAVQVFSKLYYFGTPMKGYPFRVPLEQFSQLYAERLMKGDSKTDDLLSDAFAEFGKELVAIRGIVGLSIMEFVDETAANEIDVVALRTTIDELPTVGQIAHVCIGLSRYFHGSPAWRITKTVLTSWLAWGALIGGTGVGIYARLYVKRDITGKLVWGGPNPAAALRRGWDYMVQSIENLRRGTLDENIQVGTTPEGQPIVKPVRAMLGDVANALQKVQVTMDSAQTLLDDLHYNRVQFSRDALAMNFRMAHIEQPGELPKLRWLRDQIRALAPANPPLAVLMARFDSNRRLSVIAESAGLGADGAEKQGK
jgi:hypothetical protein